MTRKTIIATADADNRFTVTTDNAGTLVKRHGRGAIAVRFWNDGGITLADMDATAAKNMKVCDAAKALGL